MSKITDDGHAPGIAGVVYAENLLKEACVQRMLPSVSYRGNDPPKIWRKGNVELGVRGSGTQYDPQSPYIILFDGVLHNFDELRKLLEKEGWDRNINSVEDLIAACFQLWEERFAPLLNGRFSIAIFDQAKQEMVLIRDRIGEKPLYWSFQNDHFLFASEIKALLRSDLVPQIPDLEALSYYLSFGFIPQEKSPIKKVYKLQPGHYLRFTKEKNLQIRPYWSYSMHLKTKQKHAHPQQLTELIRDSICLRVSKGMHCGYILQESNEEHSLLPYLPSDPFQTPLDVLIPSSITPSVLPSNVPLKNTQVPIHAETIIEDLTELIWHLDEPLSDIGASEYWQLCKAAKNQGADTILSTAGSIRWLQKHIYEPSLPWTHDFDIMINWLERNTVIPLLSKINFKRTCAFLRSVNTHPWHKAFLSQYALFPKKRFSRSPSKLCTDWNPELFLHRFPALEELGPSLSSLLYLNLKTELPSRCLLQEERVTAAHGLTIEAPFLDFRIVEYFASIPDRSKNLQYLSLNHIFLRSSKKNKPGSIQTDSWKSSPKIAHLFSKLSKGVLVEAGLISPEWLSSQIKKISKSTQVFEELWSVLMLETWFLLYIERSIHASPSQPKIYDLLR
ncbi:MAG TPA: asparagine synthase-related protein [Rhabdochlamydiaceae bacterium]|nr:asparagine synthase-related protein [Rhabdochlamydiaceae bacterium]